MRWLLIVVLCLIIAGVVYWSNQRGVLVKTAVIKTGTIRSYVAERAKTRLPKIYRITMPLDGRIRPITLQEGALVEAGEVVAELDPDDLETELKEAQARHGQYGELMQAMQKTIAAAIAQRDAIKPKFEFAVEEFERISKLGTASAATQSALGRAKMEKLQSEFEYKQENFNVQSMEAINAAVEIASQEAYEGMKRKQRDRNRATLRTPVAGMVLQRQISNERVLSAGEVLLEIGQMNDLEIEAEILTQDVVKIESGDEVAIEGPAIGLQAIQGVVKRIYPQGFTKISSLGVEQQRVLVVIDFAEDELERLKKQGRSLGVDFRVRVKIFTDQSEQARIIPRSALFRGNSGQWQCFAVRNGAAELIDLKVGLLNDFEAEVLNGLAAEEQVILAPDASLESGQRVEI